MIYEFRKYNLTPGAVPQVLELFGAGYVHRKKHSELAAFWYTEVGPLNQIIHVWPYESIEHRNEVRVQAAASGQWPPKGERELIERQSSMILSTAPFSPLQ